MSAPIPALVIGGYLGAGKTTLINAFLRDPGGRRVTVLVNDFGAINIDAGLIENADGDTIALTNGCACCAIGSDLFEAARAAAAGPRRPDLLLVEASGVAQPDRLRALLAGVGALASARYLTVVNGRTVREIAADKYVGALFRAQIRAADGIFVNRTAPAAEAWMQSRFPDMRRIAAATDLPRLAETGTGRSRRSAAAGPPGHPCRSEIVRLPGPLSGEALAAWIAALPPEVERVKGFVMLLDGNGGVETRYLSYARGGFELTKADKARVSDCGSLAVIARAGTLPHVPLPRLS